MRLYLSFFCSSEDALIYKKVINFKLQKVAECKSKIDRAGKSIIYLKNCLKLSVNNKNFFSVKGVVYSPSDNSSLILKKNRWCPLFALCKNFDCFIFIRICIINVPWSKCIFFKEGFPWLITTHMQSNLSLNYMWWPLADKKNVLCGKI